MNPVAERIVRADVHVVTAAAVGGATAVSASKRLIILRTAYSGITPMIPNDMSTTVHHKGFPGSARRSVRAG